MIIRWLPMREAKRFIRQHHRHCKRLAGGIVALGCWVGGELVGVAVIGRCNARMDTTGRAEITRLCTDGHPNACSKLYGKAKRLAQALGFVGIKTFTRKDESGSSLFAVRAQLDGVTDGGAWGREGRERADENTEPKRRWRL